MFKGGFCKPTLPNLKNTRVRESDFKANGTYRITVLGLPMIVCVKTDAENVFKQLFCLGSGCGSVGRAVLPIPEVRGSNPVICKKLFILNICLLSTVY